MSLLLPGDDICIKPDAVIIPTVFLQWLSIIIDTHMVASENSGNWQITKLFAAVRMTFYVHFNKSELSTL